MSEYDVIVVGAGPSGSSAAKAAAEKGAKAILIERHQSIGIPVRCSGTLYGTSFTEAIRDSLPERVILQRHKYRRFYSHKGGILQEINVAGRGECIIERDEFDRELARQAVKAGAAVVVNTNVEGLLKENGQIKGVVTNSRSMPQILGKIVIAAGGDRSKRMGITKQEGMNIPGEEFFSGVYFEIAGVKDGDPEVQETHFWHVTARNHTNLWARGGDRYSLVLDKLELFEQLKQLDYPLSRRLRDAYPLRIYGWTQGRLDGFRLPEGMVKDGLILAGNAGGFQGLVHACVSGRFAGEVAGEAIKEGNVSAQRLHAYEEKCEKAKLSYIRLSCMTKGGESDWIKLHGLSSDEDVERWVAERAERKELDSFEQRCTF